MGRIMGKLVSKPWLDMVVIGVAVVAVYGNILGNGLVWDDYAFVVEWEQIRDLGANWGQLWAGAVPEGHQGVYRPVRSVLYGMSYGLWQTNAAGYHAWAVGVQILASGLVYLITVELTKRRLAGLIAGVLFGVHPVHVEAISWVAASFDSAGVVVMLGSIYAYLRANRKGGRSGITRGGWYWASVGLAAAAYFTNEITLVLPGLLGVVDVSLGKLKRKNWAGSMKVYVPYLATNLMYWIVRLDVVMVPSGHARVYESWFSNALLAVVMVGRYVWLMVVPILEVNHWLLPGVSGFYYLDFNFERPPSPISWGEWQVVVAVVGVVAGLIWVSKKRKRLPMVFLGGWWLVVALVPVLVAPSFGIIFAERYAYLASVGVAIMAGSQVAAVGKRFLAGGRPLTVVGFWLAVGVMIGGYGYVSILRNRVWKDGVSLWSREVGKRPESAIMHTNLGLAYRRNGENKRAVVEFERAVEINPNNVVNQQALAAAYEVEGEFERALPPLLELVKLNPRNFGYYIQAADAYYQLGRYEEAARYYTSALRIEPRIEYAKVRLAEITATRDR